MFEEEKQQLVRVFSNLKKKGATLKDWNNIILNTGLPKEVSDCFVTIKRIEEHIDILKSCGDLEKDVELNPETIPLILNDFLKKSSSNEDLHESIKDLLVQKNNVRVCWDCDKLHKLENTTIKDNCYFCKKCINKKNTAKLGVCDMCNLATDIENLLYVKNDFKEKGKICYDCYY